MVKCCCSAVGTDTLNGLLPVIDADSDTGTDSGDNSSVLSDAAPSTSQRCWSF